MRRHVFGTGAAWWLCRGMIIAAVILFGLPVGFGTMIVYAQEESTLTDISEEKSAQEYLDLILDELDLREVDEIVFESLPERIRFSDMVKAFVQNGVSGLDEETLLGWVYELFFYEFAQAKPLFIRMLLFAVLFAVVNRFFMQGGKYVGDMSFLMVYGAMMLLLMQSFLLVQQVAKEGVEQVTFFLSALVPTYATTLLLSGNAASAGIFYEMTFSVIFLLEWSLKTFLIPLVHIYVLLELLDHFFEEEKLSKLAELLESVINWILKIAMGGVVGLNVVQSLIAPVRDRMSESAIFKTLSALPGIGSGVRVAEEVVLTCGMMVKNSVGAAGLILLFLFGLVPVIKVFCFHLLYRFLAAMLQPVADKRIVECIHGVAKGGGLYLKILVDTMLLFLITIAMITASTSFVY